MTQESPAALFAGAVRKQSSKETERPLINVTLCENGVDPYFKSRVRADDVRKSAYWGSLLNSAGVSYCADGVRNWTRREINNGDGLPVWQKSLFLPGAKQIFRSADHDVLARATECIACGDGGSACEALQRPVMIAGQLVEPLPTIADARRYAAESLARLPATCLSLFASEPVWRVDISPELAALHHSVSKGARA